MKVTTAEAAAHCGYRTRAMIYKLLQRGQLDGYVVERKARGTVLETAPAGLPSLREHVRDLVQLRWDSPLGQRLPEAAVEVDAGPQWERVAEQLNAYLGERWPAPPWSGDQAATVAMCLSLAEELVAGE